jgi:hypothetical protein
MLRPSRGHVLSIPLIVALAVLSGGSCDDGDEGRRRSSNGAGAGSSSGTNGSGAGAGSPNATCGPCAAEQVCNARVGCAECADDGDCTDPMASVCILGTCAACAGNFDCALNQACQPTEHECALACSGDDDCDGDAPLCDLSRGGCVECLDASSCGGRPFCNGATGTCADCLSDAHCSVTEPACHLPTGTCVRCVHNEHCGAGFVCVENRCETECATDAACQGSNTPVCFAEGGYCVECNDASSCDGLDLPACSAERECVACTTDDHCLDATQPACATYNQCVPCTGDQHCTGAPGTPYCVDETCVACALDGDCLVGQTCNGGQCL